MPKVQTFGSSWSPGNISCMMSKVDALEPSKTQLLFCHVSMQPENQPNTFASPQWPIVILSHTVCRIITVDGMSQTPQVVADFGVVKLQLHADESEN